MSHTTALRPNIMGGTNVIISRNGTTYHVASYATASNARRAIRSGAAIRRAIRIER